MWTNTSSLNSSHQVLFLFQLLQKKKKVNECFILPSLLLFHWGRALWSIALVSHREAHPWGVGRSADLCAPLSWQPQPLVCSLSVSPCLPIPYLSRLFLCYYLFLQIFSPLFFPSPTFKCLKGLIMYIDNPYKLLFWGLFIDFQAWLPSGILINHL